MSNAANGLHINKQRWKILLAFMVLIVIAVSLFLSNNFLSKLGDKEQSKATQWVEAIKKKGALVQLSNDIFSELKKKERQKINVVVEAQKVLLQKSDLSKSQDVEFSLSIIQSNTDIPVVLLTEENGIMQYRNMESIFGNTADEARKDSICIESAKEWKAAGQFQLIEYLDGEFLQFIFGSSFELGRLNIL